VVDVAVGADAAVEDVEGAVEDVVEGAVFHGLLAEGAAASRDPPAAEEVVVSPGRRVGAVTHAHRVGARGLQVVEVEVTPVRPVAEFHVPPAGVLHDPLNCLPAAALRVQAEVACLRPQVSVPAEATDLQSAAAHLNCRRAIVQAEGQRTGHRNCLRDRVPARAQVRVQVQELVPEHSPVSAQAKGMSAISSE
jgi:hypothetical protein